MSNTNQNREEAIFDAALQLPAPQRAEYICKACGDDEALRCRVEALLAADQQAGKFLDEPVASMPKATIALSFESTEKTGDKIGRYKLLQQIGEGGCGVVYMAEQEEPVRRRVALKVIKLGMDTKSVIARFEAERQALAMMDHPNIAKVLDAGTTENGRPFFVMELVRGIRMTDYCDQNKLDTQARLELFIQVCNAIQHAHQKGIIHRDIKPSNILVTLHDGQPVPKVIDFGIAKATQGRLTDQTLFTAFEQFIGTPAYMSPEQAEMSGLDVDTRSDIYALGVLLYELLTGRTPFDPKELLQSGLDELRRTIREKEPARPSTRLSTMLDADLTAVAQRRQAEAPRLIHLLQGDLDWIVMKSLEKDRTRRYETANGLALDVQRYLGNEPVTARPPSTWYRFQKLVRRNKAIFAGAGVGIAALVIGLVLSLFLFVQERAALQRAMAAERKEKQLREQAEESAAWSRQIGQGELLLMAGKYEEAEAVIRNVPPHASLVALYNVFGSKHARRGNWQEALTNWNMVVKYAPEDHIGYMYLAPLLLQMDNANGYKEVRTQILRHFGSTTDPRIAERMVKACLILPPTSEELASIVKMTDTAMRGEQNHAEWGYNLLAKGLAEYRLGHYASALETLQPVPPFNCGPVCRSEAFLVMAMAQYQLGQPAASRESFAKGMAEVQRRLQTIGDAEDAWGDWIIIQMFKREALGFMPGLAEGGEAQPPAPAAPPKPMWQEALMKAGIKFDPTAQDDGTWEVEIEDQPVTDISALRGAPISRLSLAHTMVSDLGPLKGMPIRKLWLAGTRVVDLTPLAGMRLSFLQLSGAPVADLGPLKGMPLCELKLTGCNNITNMDALAGMTSLQNLILPPNAEHFEFLRGFPNLTNLSFRYDPVSKGAAQKAAEFWAEHDGKGKAASGRQ